MRRALPLLAALVVAAGLVVALLVVLAGRDQATFGAARAAAAPGRLTPDQGCARQAPGPGFRYATEPPASGPHAPAPITRDMGRLTRDQLLQAVEAGDVVLVYGRAGDEGPLRALADDVAGPFDPALVRAGAAVLLDRRPGTDGVVAVAFRRLLRVRSPTDPRLRAFADAWQGHGCGQAPG